MSTESSNKTKSVKHFTEADLAPLLAMHQETINKDHLDRMGHMNMNWYLKFFNHSTWSFFHSMGLTREYMVEHRRGTFVLESHIRYVSEVLEGQQITVRTRLVDRSPKRIYLMHFMWNEDKKNVAATFETVNAHIDLKVRQMAPFPDHVSEKLDEHLSQHQRLEWGAPVCGAMRA